MHDSEITHSPDIPPSDRTGSNASPSHFTVSQAYEYLIASGLPRSKKTIRKWCRLDHVDKQESVLAGGPKWLITRKSLDARIAEEKRIDASLSQETGPNRSEPVPERTGSDTFEPVRTREIVDILKDQLSHERAARKSAEGQNRQLIEMYHEIATTSAQVGIEIGKGMREQARSRRLSASENDPSPTRARSNTTPSNTAENEGADWSREVPENRHTDGGVDNPEQDHDGPVIESHQ